MLAVLFIALVAVVLGVFLVVLARGGDLGRSVDGSPAAPARRGTAIPVGIAIVWVAFTGAAAANGRLTFAGVPPTAMVVIVVSFALTLTLAFSETGRRMALAVPLAALVGFQGFRLPLELLMHRAYTDGIMPVQMSYSGLNFDIVTGITALVLGGVMMLRPVATAWVRAWNALGFLLLLIVIAIAIFSAPLPFRVFMNEPANVWITQFPYIWLPAVLVQLALLGHILVIRRLRAERS